MAINPIRRLLLLAHPVGSYYWSDADTDPGALFGGVWERVKDVFVLAAGDAYAAGATGGEAAVTLTEEELPSITGKFGAAVPGMHDNYRSGVVHADTIATSSAGQSPIVSHNSGAIYGYSIDFGGGEAHDNMPPYITAYCWRRTA